MPQLIGLVLLGAGVIAGYKAVRRAIDQMSPSPPTREETAPAGLPKDLGALEFDPATGVYSPRKP